MSGLLSKPDDQYDAIRDLSLPIEKEAETNTEMRKRIAVRAGKAKTNPTEKEKESGRYRKGRFSFHGLRLAIENPKGSTRSGVGEDGKKWTNKMYAHYGYIESTEGADSDPIDVFVGDEPHSEFVVVINQVDPKTKKFDEIKAMLGYTSVAKAKACYLKNYDKGWKGLGSATAMTMEQFKWWLENQDTSKPIREGFFAAPENRKGKGASRVLFRQRMTVIQFKAARDIDEIADAPHEFEESVMSRAAQARPEDRWCQVCARPIEKHAADDKRPSAKSLLPAGLLAVAKEVMTDDGYGFTYFHPEDKKVWFEVGDWHGDDVIKPALAKLKKVKGVSEVQYEHEGLPSYGKGWIRVWAAVKGGPKWHDDSWLKHAADKKPAAKSVLPAGLLDLAKSVDLEGGYGTTFFHPEDKQVWFMVGDWHDHDVVDPWVAKFNKIKGVSEVEVEHESAPAKSKGWIRVWASGKKGPSWHDKPPPPFTIAVDLDGTLAKHFETYDDDSIPDPRPGARKWMRQFHDRGYRIIIFTVRGNDSLVREWLGRHEIPFDYINRNPDQPEGASDKVLADVYIDDRGVDARTSWKNIAKKVGQREKKAEEAQAYEVAKSSIHGNGVFAARDLKKGDSLGTAMKVRGKDEFEREKLYQTRLGRNLNYGKPDQSPNTGLRKDSKSTFELYALEDMTEGQELLASSNYHKEYKALDMPDGRVLMNGTTPSDLEVEHALKPLPKEAADIEAEETDLFLSPQTEIVRAALGHWARQRSYDGPDWEGVVDLCRAIVELSDAVAVESPGWYNYPSATPDKGELDGKDWRYVLVDFKPFVVVHCHSILARGAWTLVTTVVQDEKINRDKLEVLETDDGTERDALELAIATAHVLEQDGYDYAEAIEELSNRRESVEKTSEDVIEPGSTCDELYDQDRHITGTTGSKGVATLKVDGDEGDADLDVGGTDLKGIGAGVSFA